MLACGAGSGVPAAAPVPYAALMGSCRHAAHISPAHDKARGMDCMHAAVWYSPSPSSRTCRRIAGTVGCHLVIR